MFSDHNYGIVWGNRLGFAKVAITAKAVKSTFLKYEFKFIGYH